jgi:protein phosphatase
MASISAEQDVIEIGVATDVGRKRELNEDAIMGQILVEGAGNPWRLAALIAVADGMGGHDGGEVASGLAGSMIQRIFASDHNGSFTQEEVSGQDLLRRLNQAVRQINQEVHENVPGEGNLRPGTTLTLCLIRPREYCVGHVGDSRAYLIRPGGIEQVTEDDSYVAELVRRGMITEEQARQDEHRNIITKAIGLQPEVEPSVYYGHWQRGDMLLVCSDGLSEYVLAPELLSLAQSGLSPQQLCDRCIQLANERGGHDNISVAVARNGAAADTAGTTGNIIPGENAGGAYKPETWPPAGEKNKGQRQGIAWDVRQVKILLTGVVIAVVVLAGLWFWVHRKHSNQNVKSSQQSSIDKDLGRSRDIPENSTPETLPDSMSSKSTFVHERKHTKHQGDNDD